MSRNEQVGGPDWREELSEADREILSEGLRAFARLINEQAGFPTPSSSSGPDGAVPVMDSEEFWDTYGANIVRFCNYVKYGYWRPEDGLDVYEPRMVETPDGLQPAFVRVKASTWKPPAP